MTYKTAKYGGSSLKDRDQIGRTIEINRADPSKLFLVLSAPGGKPKVTDLLISAASEYHRSHKSPSAERVKQVFSDISCGEFPGIIREINSDMDRALSETSAPNYLDRVKALGERGLARLYAEIARKSGLPCIFVDHTETGLIIKDGESGPEPDETCYPEIGRRLEKIVQTNPGKRIVIPGYYGLDSRGQLKALPRNGSDTIASVIAVATNSARYENWTDQPGLGRASPEFVDNAEIIPEITINEIRRLTARGDFKMPFESLIPLINRDVPLQIKDTNHPKMPGTLVTQSRTSHPDETIVGISSRRGYTALQIYKRLANESAGFGAKVFGTIAAQGVPYAYSPDDIDVITVLIQNQHLEKAGKLEKMISAIKSSIPGAEVTAKEQSYATISIVGQMMASNLLIAGRAITALGKAGVQQKTIEKGSDIGLVVSIDPWQEKEAVRAVYNEFFPEKK